MGTAIPLTQRIRVVGAECFRSAFFGLFYIVEYEQDTNPEEVNFGIRIAGA